MTTATESGQAVRPRLSFCIATMNRAAVIGETLASLASQWSGGLELAIIDGSSDGATERIVSDFQPRMPGLRYRRQAPAGFDRDYCAAVACSTAEYCWLFPDDDVLRPGAIEAVLKALESAPDILIINAEVRDAALREVLDGNRLGVTADLRFRADQFEAFAEVVLRQEYVSYVGSLVIRRQVWDERAKEAYFGTDFLPVGVVLQRAFAGDACVLAEPWITIRYGVGQWRGRALAVWNVQWPALIWSFDALSERLRGKTTPREPWRDFRRLVGQRANDWLNWTVYRRVLQPLRLGIALRCWIWLLCLVPFPLVNRWFAARCRRRGLGFSEWELNNCLAEWRRARRR